MYYYKDKIDTSRVEPPMTKRGEQEVSGVALLGF